MNRALFTAIAVGLVAGCWVKPVTREDRRAVSKAMAARPKGTIATDRELELADQDGTLVCYEESTTGSHIRTKRCRTRRQVVEEEEKARLLLSNRTCGDCKSK